MKTNAYPLAFAVLVAALVSSPLHAAKPAPSIPPPVGTAGGWALSGNAGTNPTTQFLGTTDNQPLELRQNGQRVMRFEPGDPLLPGTNNVIGGSSFNTVDADVAGATIGGGGAGKIMPESVSTWANEVRSDFATVAGGLDNVAGGLSFAASIGGGASHYIVWGDYGTISGGRLNRVAGNFAAVAGGDKNNAGGEGAFVAGGRENNADGKHSLAAGYRTQAYHEGTFVWADSSTHLRNNEGRFTSHGPNEFRILASGGVHLPDVTNLNFGAKARQMVNLWKNEYGIGVQTNIQYARSPWGFAWFKGGVHADAYLTPGAGGSTLMSLTPSGLTVNGTFVSTSDRNKKENFTSIDSAEVLAKVAALPISRWSYKDDDAKSAHVGPMAQDFYAAFKLGADDKHIATVDADGIALVAIQALNAELARSNARIAELEALVKSLAAKR